MELAKVVSWGRSFKEYRAMFSLSDTDIEKTILGCADGPAKFNAELTESGGHIASVDPVYQFNADDIRARINNLYPEVMLQMINNKDSYVWEAISSVEEMGYIRMEAMNKFLRDYESGKRSGRYLNESLPTLPFTDNLFELALCSHYLFLYSEHVNQDQHIVSMMELCRVL